MATVSSLGIGSGIDLSSIVSGLVEAERAPTENRLAFQEQNLNTELSAFGLLRSALSGFQGSLSTLKSSSVFNAKSINLSDTSIFKATVENYADTGSYSVEVNSLARAHSIATNAATTFSDVNQEIGTGTLTLRFGTTTTGPYNFTQDTSKPTHNITVSAANGNNTLSGLRDYINDNDFDVQASIVDDGTGYRLILTSTSTGAANSMEISVTGDGDGNDTDNLGLSQLAFNASAQTSAQQTVAASDAQLTINGVNVTRETNTITGAINGVTLDLLKADIGNIVSVTVSENRSEAASAIEAFVEGYNELNDTIKTLTAYNPDTNTAGILLGDFTVRSITSNLRNQLTSTASQLTGEIRSLAEIGIKTNQDGSLSLDSSALNDALESDADAVMALFALNGEPSDSEITYNTATAETEPGTYEVFINNLASRASYNGSTLNNLTIDADNDNFTLSVDGVTSNNIALAQGVYASADELATHIQTQINSDAKLKEKGVSVTVTYDSGNNRFDIMSNSYGSSSSLEFISVDTNSAADIGFSTGPVVSGVDVSGTINGRAATGSGQLLTSIDGSSQGLAIEVTGNITGSRGSVVFSRGVAEAMDSVLNSFLESDGLIDSRVDGLNAKLSDIADQRQQLDLRITKLEERLVAQFAALDTLIAQFNSTSSFLSQQLANLPQPNSINANDR